MAHPAWPVELLRGVLDRVIAETGESQAALAALIQMDPSQISRWRSGKSRPSFDSLERFADAVKAAHPYLTVTKRELLSGGGYSETLADTSEHQPKQAGDLPRIGADDWWVTTPPDDLWLGLNWGDLDRAERWVWHIPNTSPAIRMRLFKALQMERGFEIDAEMERRGLDRDANPRHVNGANGA